ncbi:MAG: hypothetical protein ACRDY1_07650 [Acidimicrobiales bacterium]
MTALGPATTERSPQVDIVPDGLDVPWWSSVFDETPSDAGPDPVAGPRSGRWRWILRPVLIYLVSRVVTYAAMGVAALVAHHSLAEEINTWDTKWFIRAAGIGWPSHLPIVHGHVGGTTVAFFPAFPLTFRWLSELTGMSLLMAGAIVSGVTGLTAMIAVWALVREYAGTKAADRSTLLLALFPASIVFSLVYAEGMIITLVAGCLLALMRRRWVVAGLLAALATATAPVALAVVVSCLWSAGRAIVRHRTWAALAAPVLAPLGFVAYQVWLWRHTGDLSAWRQTELGGWHSYLSAAYPVHVLRSFFGHPLGATATINVVFVGLIVTVVCAVVALRDRLPIPLLLYGLTVAVVAILTRPVGLRPRFIMLAFPLLLAVGTRLRGRSYVTLVSVSAVLLVAFSVYTVISNAVFP